MEAEDPLSQLADIHLPQAVSFWPPAPGWWLLGALLLAAAAWFAWQRFCRWQEAQRLKRVLQELDAALTAFRRVSDGEERNRQGLALLYTINSLLKRVALVRHPEADIAALTGPEWLAFLDAHGSGDEFARGPGQVLAEGEYRPRFDADADALHATARRWIVRQYRSPAGRMRGEVAA